jgi:RND superfamily putative drug exporter
MMLVPSFLTLLRERSWYIPRWLDRLLPKVTIEPPHDGAGRPGADAEEPPAVVARP